MSQPTYIASCSFGKDSIATILLALEHDEPLDRVVFSEVMFDHARNISGEIPEHIGWIYDTAIPKLHDMGIHVDVVRAERDYCYFFANAVGGGGENAGKIYGFPLGGKCFINRDCKVAPIRKYLAEIAGGPLRAKTNIVQYIGIAADEPRRLAKLTENKISLLAKYGYTEQMAKQLCAAHGLLSPIYTTGTRARYRNIASRQTPGCSPLHPTYWPHSNPSSKHSTRIGRLSIHSLAGRSKRQNTPSNTSINQIVNNNENSRRP